MEPKKGASLQAAAMDHDGRHVLAFSRGIGIGFWDLAARGGTQPKFLALPNALTVAISSNGDRGLVGTSDGKVLLLDRMTLETLAQCRFPGGPVFATSFLDREHAVVVSMNGEVYSWVFGQQPIRSGNVPGGLPNSLLLRLAIDGDHVLAVSTDGGVYLVGPDQGETRRFEGVPSDISAIVLSREAGLWLSAHSDGVRLWDVATGEELDFLDLTSSNDRVLALAFTPSGDGFVAGMGRGAILRYDIRD